MFAWVASRTIAARSMVSVPAFWFILVLTQVGPLLGVLYERTTVFVRIASLAEMVVVAVITVWLWRRREPRA